MTNETEKRAREPWEMAHSCAMDDIESGPQTLEEVGDRMNITRERVRQIERDAMKKLSESIDREEMG